MEPDVIINSQTPLLSTPYPNQEIPFGPERKESSVLAPLSDFHFSTKTLPSHKDCLKKYFGMTFSAGGGFGYRQATLTYNENHEFSDFVANSNDACVTIVTSLFLLQSVNLAGDYLDKLAGSVPSDLKSIIEVASPEQRRIIKLKTGLGSIISGLPFLIIALQDSLPLLNKIDSETVKTIILILWAIYFYLVNVGLHVLPFALVQSPQFAYYLWPVTALRRLITQCAQWLIRLVKKTPKKNTRIDEEILQAQIDLQMVHDEMRGLIADRISRSLSHFFEETTQPHSVQMVFSDQQQGLDRLLFLLRDYPPLPTPPPPSRSFHIFLRLFGAQLELGAAFIWWTNIFPTLYNLFTKKGVNIALASFLTAALGLTPSYVLFVLLAFFGENQFPRLVHFVINAIKKFMRQPHTHIFPHIAHARPVLFVAGVLTILYLSWFAPVNAKSLNEEQYQDIFSSILMTILDIYADIGISIMAFISLLDLFIRYLIETSAVFGPSGSPSQLQARLLITRDNFFNDLMRAKPKILMEELKTLRKDDLKPLLGIDNPHQWLKQYEEKTKSAEAVLEQKKLEKSSPHIAQTNQHDIQTPPENNNSNPGLLSRCFAALFSDCFNRSRRKANNSSERDTPRSGSSKS